MMGRHVWTMSRGGRLAGAVLAMLSCAHASPSAAPSPPSPAPTTATAPRASAPASGAPSSLRSTLMGVYTADQARKGKDIYAGTCQSCHTNSDQNGPAFRAHWIGKDLSELFGYLRENMPQDNPGSLSAENGALVTAYVLQLNGLPAGAIPLSSDMTQLKQIRFDTLSPPR